MSNFRRTVTAAGVAVLLVTGSTGVSRGPSDGGRSRPAEADPQAKKLARVLKKRGYVEVPLVPDKTGLLGVKVEADGQPMLLVLDTGANNTSLDGASAKRAKVEVKQTGEKTSGLGVLVPTGRAKVKRLSIGGVSSPAEVYVVDFSFLNGMRKEHGDPPCDGVLGSNSLKYYSALIDYAGLKLYLLDPAGE